MVDVIPSRRKVKGSRRSGTLHYYLKKGTEKKKVCKMFLSTLNVGEWMVRQYAKKDNGMNMPAGNIQTPGGNRKSTDGSRLVLRKFLLDIPKMESHYCRARTNKLYLEPVFKNKAEFYREYKNYCLSSQKGFLLITVFIE
ncbi:unnamed protein product [Psylliodes chrysocephalus]|uniref:Uncharacterized protein n=1 Tax=Psylliodes chrysocephalus TaxID=3402493 RepID=A0A9P0C9Q7_9CUCU|nr:unnamed protein product [Psylliodes chrysocephala]